MATKGRPPGRGPAKVSAKRSLIEEESAIQTLEGPAAWLCGHLYPIVVSTAEGGKKRARCLGCETIHPLRAGASEAMRALREEGKTRKKVGD